MANLRPAIQAANHHLEAYAGKGNAKLRIVANRVISTPRRVFRAMPAQVQQAVRDSKAKIDPQLLRFRNSRRRIQAAILSIPLVLILLLCALVLVSLKPTTTLPPAADPTIATYSPEKPDETPIGADYRWPGGPKDPKYITISSVGIGGFIQKVGVDQNQQIAVPGNIFLGGWFVDTVLPGAEKGLSIIDGHLDGATSPGLFAKLKNVKVGDEIRIEMGDGSVKIYKVTSITVANLKDAPSVLFSQDPKVRSQLNLITCIGNYLTDAKTYDQRVIVTSALQ